MKSSNLTWLDSQILQYLVETWLSRQLTLAEVENLNIKYENVHYNFSKKFGKIILKIVENFKKFTNFRFVKYL